LDHLTEVPMGCWEQIGQNLIDKAIHQWLTKISLVKGDTLNIVWAK